MQTKFKRRQKVKLLTDPNPEYIEYHTEHTGHENIPIKKGMLGEINLILPSGRYHVKIFDEDGEELAYAPMDEEELEAVD